MKTPKRKAKKRLVRGRDFDAWAWEAAEGEWPKGRGRFWPWTKNAVYPTESVAGKISAKGRWVRVKFEVVGEIQ